MWSDDIFALFLQRLDDKNSDEKNKTFYYPTVFI